MANEDLSIQYNQLMWEMDRLREEVIKANKDYIEKLKNARKEMARVNDQLTYVSRRMGPRALSDLNSLRSVPVQHDAGFHPPVA